MTVSVAWAGPAAAETNLRVFQAKTPCDEAALNTLATILAMVGGTACIGVTLGTMTFGCAAAIAGLLAAYGLSDSQLNTIQACLDSIKNPNSTPIVCCQGTTTKRCEETCNNSPWNGLRSDEIPWSQNGTKAPPFWSASASACTGRVEKISLNLDCSFNSYCASPWTFIKPKQYQVKTFAVVANSECQAKPAAPAPAPTPAPGGALPTLQPATATSVAE